MNPKNSKKSLIHENADANITCDFGDGDISRSRSCHLPPAWIMPQTNIPQTSINNPLNPSGVGLVNFFGESQPLLYPHMRAKFGRGPTVVSKKGSLKFISRYVLFILYLDLRFISWNEGIVLCLQPSGVGLCGSERSPAGATSSTTSPISSPIQRSSFITTCRRTSSRSSYSPSWYSMYTESCGQYNCVFLSILYQLVTPPVHIILIIINFVYRKIHKVL